MRPVADAARTICVEDVIADRTWIVNSGDLGRPRDGPQGPCYGLERRLKPSPGTNARTPERDPASRGGDAHLERTRGDRDELHQAFSRRRFGLALLGWYLYRGFHEDRDRLAAPGQDAGKAEEYEEGDTRDERLCRRYGGSGQGSGGDS